MKRPDPTALRAKVASMRARLKTRRQKREPRRRWWLLVLLALLLLLLVWLCCAGPAPEPAPLPHPVEPVERHGIGPPGPIPEPADSRIRGLKRPSYVNAPPEPLPWLTSFRIQVAARSPRLAQCFVGADAPGALKWTAAVEPGSGRVSDHTLEAVLDTAPLSADQRGCVIQVLSDPPYRLEAGGEATPSRVSMAIEF